MWRSIKPNVGMKKSQRPDIGMMKTPTAVITTRNQAKNPGSGRPERSSQSINTPRINHANPANKNQKTCSQAG
jgi:hypothetical protein